MVFTTGTEKIGRDFVQDATTGRTQTQCVRCVLDKSAPEIVFDENGVCNFCHEAQGELRALPTFVDGVETREMLSKVKYTGLGRKYDCLIGLSGGVDSSYALHLAVQRGLRPLSYTIDNGYNDPKADENIMRLVETLKVPFYRYTIDLPKFRELQAAFMRAGLINIEIPTDHILMASSLEMAAKHNVKYIISGGNVATESIMPASWSYPARDLVHIKDVFRKQMKKRLSGLPVCSLLKWNWYRWVKGIKTVYILDYLGYNREEAIKVLESCYGYKPYGEKHCESTFTWWFQNFYLFEKFGIDKRKAHLSSLINSGQMTRSEALAVLGQNPVYPHLGIEQKVMAYPKGKHEDYKHDLYPFISKLVRLWKS